MAPMTNRVKVKKYFWGLITATITFAFEVKAKLGLECTHLESWVAEMGLNGSHD